MIAAQAREPGVGFAVLRSMAVLTLTAVALVWLSDAVLSRVAVSGV